jgi:hypothetical protein
MVALGTSGALAAIGGGIATAIGATSLVGTAAATAIGAGAISGGLTAIQGGSASDVLKSAIMGGVTSYAGASIAGSVASSVSESILSSGTESLVSKSVAEAMGRVAGQAVSGGIVSGTAALLTDKNPIEALIKGGLTGAMTSGVMETINYAVKDVPGFGQPANAMEAAAQRAAKTALATTILSGGNVDAIAPAVLNSFYNSAIQASFGGGMRDLSSVASSANNEYKNAQSEFENVLSQQDTLVADYNNKLQPLLTSYDEFKKVDESYQAAKALYDQTSNQNAAYNYLISQGGRNYGRGGVMMPDGQLKFGWQQVDESTANLNSAISNYNSQAAQTEKLYIDLLGGEVTKTRTEIEYQTVYDWEGGSSVQAVEVPVTYKETVVGSLTPIKAQLDELQASIPTVQANFEEKKENLTKAIQDFNAAETENATLAKSRFDEITTASNRYKDQFGEDPTEDILNKYIATGNVLSAVDADILENKRVSETSSLENLFSGPTTQVASTDTAADLQAIEDLREESTQIGTSTIENPDGSQSVYDQDNNLVDIIAPPDSNELDLGKIADRFANLTGTPTYTGGLFLPGQTETDQGAPVDPSFVGPVDPSNAQNDADAAAAAAEEARLEATRQDEIAEAARRAKEIDDQIAAEAAAEKARAEAARQEEIAEAARVAAAEEFRRQELEAQKLATPTEPDVVVPEQPSGPSEEPSTTSPEALVPDASNPNLEAGKTPQERSAEEWQRYLDSLENKPADLDLPGSTIDAGEYFDEYNENLKRIMDEGGYTSQWQNVNGDKVFVSDDGTAIGVNENGGTYPLSDTQVEDMVNNGLLNTADSGYVAATGGTGDKPGGYNQCGDGFHWDEARQICIADTDKKEDDECPPGYIRNLNTGTCVLASSSGGGGGGGPGGPGGPGGGTPNLMSLLFGSQADTISRAIPDEPPNKLGLPVYGEMDKFEGPLDNFLKIVMGGSYVDNSAQQPQQAENMNNPNQPDFLNRQPSYFNYGMDTNIDQNLFGGQNSFDNDQQLFGNQNSMNYDQQLFGGQNSMAYNQSPFSNPNPFKAGGLAVPLMAEGGTTRYGKYAGGGLNVVEHSGKHRLDFRKGAAVTGAGDGQSDDIPAMLADGEFVFPADVVAALGNGSTKAGSDKLYDMMHAIRAYHRSAKPKDLPPPAKKSPLDYLKKPARKARG